MNDTRKKVLNLLKKGLIKSNKDLRKYNILHKPAGSGAFRQVFVILPKNEKERFVIKFPFSGCEYHSQSELRAIRKIQKTQKLAFLRPFLPAVLYSDYRSGIIAMEYYFKSKKDSQHIVAEVLEDAYEALVSRGYPDISYWNIRETGSGQFKLIDLGCFEY